MHNLADASKISNTFTNSAEDVGINMPMYNLLKYSENYSMTSGSFWNYYRDEINSDTNTNNTARNKIYNNKMITYKSFEYETKLLGSMPNNNNILGTEVAVPLKYLSNFWRSLYLTMINCEMELEIDKKIVQYHIKNI